MKAIFFLILFLFNLILFILSVVDYFNLNHQRLWDAHINSDAANIILMIITGYGGFNALSKAFDEKIKSEQSHRENSLSVTYRKLK